MRAVIAVQLLVVEHQYLSLVVCAGLLQIFDQRLDNLDSTINQLESAWQQLLDAGYLSDEDTGKRQVCAAADVFSHGRNSQHTLSSLTCCTW